MLENKLKKILEEAEEIRQRSINNESSSFRNDVFNNLSDFILKKLNSLLFKDKNAKIIANLFDIILPYIVQSNIDIILLNINLLIKQPNFKEKFIEGLKKYPYMDGIDSLFYNIWSGLNDDPNKFDNFIDDNILKTISTMDVSSMFYSDMLNRLNEENQKKFLNILVENNCDIPYAAIEYKGNNKQIIYDNLPLFIKNAQNLYSLMNFVKDNPSALSQVKNYIDNNEEKAINSIFCETDHLVKMKDSTLKEIVKLMILEVMKNENVKFSDITYNSGGFSRVLLIGDKVIKIGDRVTKKFPNNPYIIAPLLRKKLEINGESCFAEVTERVDTDKRISREELYQLFKNLRNLGLVWTDIKETNVGRLRKDNIIHWQENLYPTDEILGLDTKRGQTLLKAGDLVILDADFIYDENDPNIQHTDRKAIFDEFERRYQMEKKQSKEGIIHNKEDVSIVEDEINYNRGIHR